MIVQGLKLTMVGMMVVFSFLVLLLIVIHLSAKLLKSYTEKESLSVISRKPSGPREAVPSPDDNKKLTAVISAAIAAHRARLGRNRLS